MNLPGKPRFRGFSHQIAAIVAPVCGAILIIWAPEGRGRTGAIIFALGLSLMFTTSALYHRPNWKRPRARWWMARADQGMIFVLIASSFTPFALAVDTNLSSWLLPTVWIVAGVFILGQLFPIKFRMPKWAIITPFIALGWLSALLIPQIFTRLSISASVLVAIGGALYTAGAIIYARKSPNPRPMAFGYHEIFHLFVIAAAACHYAAVAIAVT